MAESHGAPNSPYARELAVAGEAARAAGSLLLEMRGAALRIREKADRSLITEADLAAERAILARLAAAFPGDGLFSEEAGALGPEGSRLWIVDPLDGTSNYARGIPFFAVSIALWEAGEPAVAALYMPVLDELFLADRAGPATLNGAPIRVSPTERLEAALVNADFDRFHERERGLELFRRVAHACEGRVKTIGSSACLLAYVACGRVDAYLRNRINRWDYAAGLLLVERAGGRVTDFEGRPLSDGHVEAGTPILATNGALHEALLAIAQSV